MSRHLYILFDHDKALADSKLYVFSYIRSLLLIRAVNIALAMSTPALAFLDCGSSGHTLEVATVSTSRTLLMLRKWSLSFSSQKYRERASTHMFLHTAISFNSIAHGRNTIPRFQQVLEAELVTENPIVEPPLPNAVEFSCASSMRHITPRITLQDRAEIP